MRLSKSASMSGKVLLVIGVLAIALLAGRMWARLGDVADSPGQGPEPTSLHETKNLVTGDKQYTLSIPLDRQQANDSQNVWEALQKILKVERLAPFEDPEKSARAAAKRSFNLLRQRVKELEALGLEGEDLYAALEQRLEDENAEESLRLLSGYRRLEEDLAGAGLDGMHPEDRFEYVVKARRDAFGEETAEDLFFEKEAYTRYKMEEQAIAQDTDLTESEKRAEIVGRRNTLQVELASRGSYVSFADERQSELTRKLLERYGESLQAMSEEERRAAILELYREELPPDTLDKVEQVLSAQAERRAQFDAHRSEMEAILADEDLSFEEQQERLEELSAEYDTRRRSAEL